jgi:hypothetical protein
MEAAKMRKEYDFSKGEKGKFFRHNAKMNVPVYLDGEVDLFIEKIATERGVDKADVVNDILRIAIALSKAVE